MCYPDGLDSWEEVPEGLGKLIGLVFYFVFCLAMAALGG